MFQQKSEFKQIDDNSVLWRYQDLPRYLDLLLKQQLFFCRADRFEDPFEGKYPIHNQLPGDIEKDRDSTSDSAEANEEEQRKKNAIKRPFVTLNSWHSNKDENYAMWKIYAKGTYGLAIQTTYKRLKHCFHTTDKPVFIGKVNYYDDHEQSNFCDGSLLPFLSKRKIYQYESEVRCCYELPQNKSTFDWQAQGAEDGIFIPVDINILIERIYISPYSPKWIGDIVQGINEKFNINKEIVHSTVFESPDY
jgi:hypothetical protein